MDICIMDGCNKPVAIKLRGLCYGHYTRWKRHRDPSFTVYEKHSMRHSPEYSTWIGMKTRCNNKNEPGYKHYGGRGIKVCEKWQNSFVAFYKDMGKRPTGKSLDRINNDGHYEPGNCRWATSKEQANNQRMKCTNTSGFRGVSYYKPSKKWRAAAQYEGKLKHIGYFYTAEEAYSAFLYFTSIFPP